MRRTGFVFHPDFLLHSAGALHPESPQRLEAILSHLRQRTLWEKLSQITPQPADLQWIETIHSVDYIQSVRQACAADGVTHLDADTGICPRSYEIALLAAGAGMTAADKIISGEIDNAFCAVRPPGHHAEYGHAMGFCLFNNIAILARYLQKKQEIERILIVDWDVHHGNGTQNTFYADPSVFYFSIHQWPHYPGSGAANERGSGKGLGFTLNAPMRAGSGDQDYAQAFVRQLIPAAEKFKPQFVLISAGFDAHKDDPLAGMNLTETGFTALSDIVFELAQYYCEGRLISLLEGGYHLKKLAASVAAHLSVLSQEASP
ncbi:MAG: histone deacetylase [Calditrichaeota bacterium]|nr:histone deacetylase [Calditrichota bacterium]